MQQTTNSLQMLAARLDLLRPSVVFALQLLYVSQIWTEEQGFHSDLAASAAALHVSAKLHIPEEVQLNARYTIIEAFGVFFVELEARLRPLNILLILDREAQLLQHVDFDLSAPTPSEWIEFQRAS